MEAWITNTRTRGEERSPPPNRTWCCQRWCRWSWWTGLHRAIPKKNKEERLASNHGRIRTMVAFITVNSTWKHISVDLNWNRAQDTGQVSQDRIYQRNDSLLVLLLSTHHRVALPSSGLSVGEDADVVSLEGVQEHLLSDVPVHLHLRRKAEVLWLQTRREGGWGGGGVINRAYGNKYFDFCCGFLWGGLTWWYLPWCVTNKSSQNWSFCSL